MDELKIQKWIHRFETNYKFFTGMYMTDKDCKELAELLKELKEDV